MNGNLKWLKLASAVKGKEIYTDLHLSVRYLIDLKFVETPTDPQIPRRYSGVGHKHHEEEHYLLEIRTSLSLIFSTT
jgi:hypothetical protein